MASSPASRNRDAVIARYSGLARTALAGATITDCDPDAFAGGGFGAAAYTGTDRAPQNALRASLGCGNPLAVADLHPGQTVLDLGSGGGLDVLLSARRVPPAAPPTAWTPARTCSPSRRQRRQEGVTNATFLRGHIEDIPLPDRHVDVVISNCVINLSTDKPRVLAEAFRVLRPGGRLGVSDVIADEHADPAQLADAEQRVGCLNGALTQAQYRDLLLAAGFTRITITPTHQAEPGLHSAIVQAAKPPGAS